MDENEIFEIDEAAGPGDIPESAKQEG